jgi:hypothetical protein
MAVGKVAAHLCLTLIDKGVKVIVDQGKVVTTLDIIEHLISFSVSQGHLLGEVVPR